MKKALIIGATGLIGSMLTEALLRDDTFDEVHLLVRRSLPLSHPKLKQQLFDFDHPQVDLIQGEVLFCAMGTTLRKAGSQAAQYKIDCLYPFEVAKNAKQQGIKQFILVSSIGADAQSSNFYLRTKGDLEEKLKSLAFDSLVLVRPSLIMGERQERRLGEKIAMTLMPLLNPLLIGKLRKYRGVAAERIVATLIEQAKLGTKGITSIESDQIA